MMTIITYVGDEKHEPTPEMINKVHEDMEERFDELIVTAPYFVDIEKLEEEDFEKIKVSDPEKFLEKTKEATIE